LKASAIFLHKSKRNESSKVKRGEKTEVGEVTTTLKGIFCPQPACHLPNSLWPGILKLFPAREIG
jgi:hypothetical protein